MAAGACAALRPQDYIASTHRGHGHCISKGADLRLMMAEITGKATGYCKGGGSMHISSKQLNHLGATCNRTQLCACGDLECAPFCC